MQFHPFLQENFIPLSDCKVAPTPRAQLQPSAHFWGRLEYSPLFCDELAVFACIFEGGSGNYHITLCTRDQMYD